MTDILPKKSRPQPKGGSRKGIPNKVTSEVKQMVLAALDGAGGVGYLIEQAHAKPAAFLALLGKVMPLQVTGADGDPLALAITVRYAKPTPRD